MKAIGTRRLIVFVVAVPLMLLGAACASGSRQDALAPTTTSTATSTSVAQDGRGVPATYQQACANEGPICQSKTTGSVPTVLKRSLHFPVVRPGQPCPTTPGAVVSNSFFVGVALGHGPVRPILAAFGDLLHGIVELSTSTGVAGWLAFKTLWFSVPAYQGPFLIRAKRLDGSGPVAFGSSPSVVPLVVPPGPTLNSSRGWRTAPGGTWVKAPGCYGWQVDGLTFSEVIVVDAVLPAGLAGQST